jgi:hypothetical protein
VRQSHGKLLVRVATGIEAVSDKATTCRVASGVEPLNDKTQGQYFGESCSVRRPLSETVSRQAISRVATDLEAHSDKARGESLLGELFGMKTLLSETDSR